MATRQGNGEAKIKQLQSGSYHTQVMVAGRRHSITGRTKGEVKKKRRELLWMYTATCCPVPAGEWRHERLIA